MIKQYIFLLCLFSVSTIFGQIGGKSVFQFLKFPISARNEALGGGVLSTIDNDLTSAISNPSLIDSALNKQITFSNSFFIGDINIGNLTYAQYHKRIKSTLTYTAQYASYGKFESRDNAGNLLGEFRAADFNFQVGTAHYWQHLYYGMNLKLIYSNLAQYNSLALATDIALGYHNKDKKISFSVLLRNAGFQLKRYDKNSEREKLPLQVDVSFYKKFTKIPIALIIVAHDLQKFKLTVSGSATTNAFGKTVVNKRKEFANDILGHFIIATEIDAGKPVRLRVGYNHLRRIELASTQKKGMAGITAGLGLNIRQFSIDYGFGAYHAAGSDHFLSLRIKIDEFGKKAK